MQKEKNMQEEFLTIKELATRWKISVWTLYRWKISIADFPKSYGFSKKNYLFKIQDVKEYEKKKLQENAKKSKKKQK